MTSKAKTNVVKLRDIINVKDYGAVGDGLTASAAANSTAIQAAIDAAAARGTTLFGATVYFPPGHYKISTGLTVATLQHVSFAGDGLVSIIDWVGANNGTILHYTAGTPEMHVTVEGILFYCSNAATGVKGLVFGAVGGVGDGIHNSSVRECKFQNLDVCCQLNGDTGYFLFEHNWCIYYSTYGVVAAATAITQSAHSYRDNHFQAGISGTYGIRHDGGSNVVIDGNTIESGTAGMKGISLNSVSDFRVTNTYYENSAALGAGDGPFLALQACTNGVVECNHTTGDTGNNIITVDASSANIVFGPNRHGSSGGDPTTFIAITAGAVDIYIIGKQQQDGGVPGATAPYSGNVSFYLGNTSTALGTFGQMNVPLNQYNSTAAVNNNTVNLVGITAGMAYLAFAKQATEGYAVAGIVVNIGGTAIYGNIFNSNAALTMGAAGANLQVTTTVVGARTVEYSLMRIF